MMIVNTPPHRGHLTNNDKFIEKWAHQSWGRYAGANGIGGRLRKLSAAPSLLNSL